MKGLKLTSFSFQNRSTTRIIMLFLASFISTLALGVNLTKGTFTKTIHGNNLTFILLLVAFFLLFNRSFTIKNRQLVMYSMVSAIILSAMCIIGFSLDTYKDLSIFTYSIGQTIKNCIKFFGLFLLFYAVIIIVFSYLKTKEFDEETKNGFLFSKRKRSFFAVWAIIFVVWVPYFLMYFPGITTVDSISQIYQALGEHTLTNHHPIAHTFLISLFLAIGNTFGSVTLGIALYSIFQMLFLSGVFSFCIYYMGRRGIHRYFRTAALLFFALFPINGTAAAAAG